ncbi:hypothetical protein PQG02_10060 [Nostoc sp. UHCC 0926]|nr:hypothetical protein PQG02_10060 [Nostoc sp. UHCC 0926]
MLINNSLVECLIEFDLRLRVAQPYISLRSHSTLGAKYPGVR